MTPDAATRRASLACEQPIEVVTLAESYAIDENARDELERLCRPYGAPPDGADDPPG